MSSPDHWPPLRDVIARHGLKAEKKLGQNFLLDQNITDKIVKLAGGLRGKTVFEIGPGPGGLTRSLLQTDAAKVIAVEFDERAVRALEELRSASGGRLEIVQGDALEIDLLRLPPHPTLSPQGRGEKRAVVANLPYNIATLLLIGWLEQVRRIPGAFDSLTLMFQKEVAERIIAKPRQKAYGRLSVISQWLCDVKKVYDLPPSAFTPAPKVSSSVVHFVPKILAPEAPSFAAVGQITAAAFGQRRKMIRTSLKDYADRLEKAGIDPELRAENLAVEDFVALAKG